MLLNADWINLQSELPSPELYESLFWVLLSSTRNADTSLQLYQCSFSLNIEMKVAVMFLWSLYHLFNFSRISIKSFYPTSKLFTEFPEVKQNKKVGSSRKQSE